MVGKQATREKKLKGGLLRGKVIKVILEVAMGRSSIGQRYVGSNGDNK